MDFIITFEFDKNVITIHSITLLISALENRQKHHISEKEKEFLEWILDREIKCKKDENGNFEIKLYEDITEDGDITEEDLEQLKQLIDYLRL